MPSDIAKDFNNAPERICVPVINDSNRHQFASCRSKKHSVGSFAERKYVQTGALLLPQIGLDFYNMARECPGLLNHDVYDEQFDARDFTIATFAFQVGNACVLVENMSDLKTHAVFQHAALLTSGKMSPSTMYRSTGKLYLNPDPSKKSDAALSLVHPFSNEDLEGVHKDYFTGEKHIEFCVCLSVQQHDGEFPTLDLYAFLVSEDPLLAPRVKAVAAEIYLRWPRYTGLKQSQRRSKDSELRHLWLNMVKDIT